MFKNIHNEIKNFPNMYSFKPYQLTNMKFNIQLNKIIQLKNIIQESKHNFQKKYADLDNNIKNKLDSFFEKYISCNFNNLSNIEKQNVNKNVLFKKLSKKIFYNRVSIIDFVINNRELLYIILQCRIQEISELHRYCLFI